MISLHILLVSVLQGVTEFLPISSSAHLIILPSVLAVKDQGIIIDIAVHLGSLFAVLTFYKKDTLALIKGAANLITLGPKTKETNLFLGLFFATIPVVIVGFLFKVNDINTLLRSLEIIGWMMILFGICLYATDRLGQQKKKVDNWTYKDAFLIGLFQVLALIPGVSRSGITISGARVLGYKRTEAIRLSMLMSIPTIIASSTLFVPNLIKETNSSSFLEILIAFILAFLSSFLTLVLLLKYIYKFKFTPYIIYRISLGLILLWLVYS